jgi:sulfofructose kinase
MMGTATIIGVGAATWDRFLLMPEFPQSEGVTQVSRLLEQGGGPVATALCTLAKLGYKAALLDAQAEDDIGWCLLQELQDHGVSTAYVKRHREGESAKAHILVRQSDGARHIIFTPATCPELQAHEVPECLWSQARLLHLNGRHEHAARKAVQLAKQAGVTISYDGGAGRYRESIRDLVLASDLRIVARDFAFKFTGKNSIDEAAQSLRADSPKLLVITDGMKGSWVWSENGEAFHQEALKVSPVVDTTGCGDVYHGAFLHGWLQQWPLEKTAVFAAKLAAENALGLGGRWCLKSI